MAHGLRRAAADTVKIAIAVAALLLAVIILWWTMGSGGSSKDLSGPLPTRTETPSDPNAPSFGG